MDVAFTLYKGFLIAEHSETDVRAYRNREYYAGNTSSYETTSQANITQMIDEADDYGYFTDVQYNEVMRLLGRTVDVSLLKAPEQEVHQWGSTPVPTQYVDPSHKMEIEVNPSAVFTDVADWTRDHKTELENAIKDSIKGIGFPGWVSVKIGY